MKTQSNYNHKIAENRWQKAWEEQHIFKFDENSAKPKFYQLEMLPYPSGKLHMGHLRNYAIGDVIARFKKMQGFNVLHPMGFDAFGLPAENAALQHKIHPEIWTLENIATMRDELKTIGLSIDWSREFATCLPDYYKHEQKIFLDFLKHGLAYQKESFVNWDPIDNTVLANEQVIDGRGWRSGALVEKRKLRQWFLKISDFSEELLSELKSLPGWDERVLTMQEKWIGKSEGAIVEFAVAQSERSLQVYTTRPDTLYGASFIAISPNHPLALELAQNNVALKNFIDECNQSAVDEQTLEKQEKKGIATGLQVLHPFDESWKLDVYIANFVLMDYGTGAIYGCPAHDERDFEFAKKYNLPIKNVVANLQDYLRETDLINFSAPNIQALVKQLKSQAKNQNDEIELSTIVYKFVRDKIDHAMDNSEKFDNCKPTLKASDVLENNGAYCFSKINLMAALLRALHIPCGFSDQLLILDEEKPQHKILHCVAAVYLKSLKKWVRLDPRGGETAKNDLSSLADKDILAYEADESCGEINNVGTYCDLPCEILEIYNKCKTNKEILSSLVDKSSAHTVIKPFTEDGIIIDSNFLNGLSIDEAKKKAIAHLEESNKGKRQINYRLRDWGVSRQRYWGCPIPVLYLEDGSIVPVPEDQLPVELPKDVEFTGTGNPLANHKTWKNVNYNGQKATRETDTFDTFFESSWYFLRYASQPSNKAFERDAVNKFLPVDQYVGGIEHAVLHLLYSRFFVKALKKCGYLDFDEPFARLTTQGMVCHRTFKNAAGEWVYPSEAIEIEAGKFVHEKTRETLTVGRSEKMSKSKKNVVEPSQIVESYGADTARLFMLSDSPVERDLEWSEAGIDGAWKYVNRLWRLVAMHEIDAAKILGLPLTQQHEITKLTHKTIAAVREEFEKLGFNRAIAKIREFTNALEKFEVKSDEDKAVMHFALNTLTKLISPIMPHLAEEMWQALGNQGLVSVAEFPQFDPTLISESSAKVAVQVAGKLRAVIELPKGTSQEEAKQAALAHENVQKFLLDKEIKKVIVVQDKMVNFVV